MLLTMQASNLDVIGAPPIHALPSRGNIPVTIDGRGTTLLNVGSVVLMFY